MNHLFIARHGLYDRGNSFRLNETGRKQMETLDLAIKEILGGGSAYIISSTAPRAIDSSQVLATQLGLSGFEELPYLWTGPDSKVAPNYKRDSTRKPNEVLLEIINERRRKADGLIVVAHFEVAGRFSPEFHRYEFGVYPWFGELQEGKAIHFDIGQRSARIIPI